MDNIELINTLNKLYIIFSKIINIYDETIEEYEIYKISNYKLKKLIYNKIFNLMDEDTFNKLLYILKKLNENLEDFNNFPFREFIRIVFHDENKDLKIFNNKYSNKKNYIYLWVYSINNIRVIRDFAFRKIKYIKEEFDN
jgi:hypothetical protein